MERGEGREREIALKTSGLCPVVFVPLLLITSCIASDAPVVADTMFWPFEWARLSLGTGKHLAILNPSFLLFLLLIVKQLLPADAIPGFARSIRRGW